MKRSSMLIQLAATGIAVLGIVQCAAAETAEELFKRSLQENLDQPIDPRKMVAFFAALGGLILATIVYNRWRTSAGRPASTTALNSPAKLIKEVCKNVSLRPSEVKQLRILSEQQNIENPLVLLLCPSALGKAVKENQKRIDRHVLVNLAKKIVRK